MVSVTFCWEFILSINNEHVQDHSCPGAFFLMDKSYLGKVGYPVLYNRPGISPLQVAPGQQISREQLQGSRQSFVPTIKLSIRPSLGRFIFVPSIPWTNYFHADHSILHHLESYFLGNHLTVNPSIPLERFVFVPSITLASYLRADHVTLHPFIPLASYFCAAHPLG